MYALRKEAATGSPPLRGLGGGSKGVRLSAWERLVLGLEQVREMFTSRAGGRKAQLIGAQKRHREEAATHAGTQASAGSRRRRAGSPWPLPVSVSNPLSR